MTDISSNYSIINGQVFCGGKLIPNSDANTFIVVENIIEGVSYFAYDKNQLYALSTAREGLQIWVDVDIKSLEFFPGRKFFSDKNHLFYFNWYFVEYANTELYPELKIELQKHKPTVDAWWNWSEDYYKSLHHISNNFYTDNERVFYLFEKGEQYDYPFSFGYERDVSYYSIISNVQFIHFSVLNDFYAKDDKFVFHFSRKINADYDTFTIINQHFAKDKNGIWCNGYFVNETIDHASFEVVHIEDDEFIYSLAKDKYSLFSTQRSTRIGKYKGYSNLLVKLDNSCPETFVIFDNIWAKDKNNVYSYGKIWRDIDAQSFEYLFTDSDFSASSYVKDKNNLYNINGRKIFKGIDGQSFIMLNEYWGKDKNIVFNFKAGRIVKTLDADTFNVIGNEGEAEDINFTFKHIPVIHSGKNLGHTELKKLKRKH